MYNTGQDAPVKEIGTYEELMIFTQRIKERMDRELAEADQAEAEAKMQRHRAEQTRRVFESVAKLQDSIANVPAYPLPMTIDPRLVEEMAREKQYAEYEARQSQRS